MFAGQPNFVELGYGPSSLSSIQEGTPIYAPGDSIWFLSTSDKVAFAKLISPDGVQKYSNSVSSSTVYRLYSFSSMDKGGIWTLEIGFENTSVLSLQIPFVNLKTTPFSVALSNYSLNAQYLNLNFTFAPNDAFNVETCVGSADVNSTLVLPIPARFGGGQMMLLGGINAAELSIEGIVTRPFTFWYNLQYSYSYMGNLSSEFISRETTVFKSHTVVISTAQPISLQISNYTSPRPGRYTMNAYFESSSGIAVEQTSALLLTAENWAWIGGCGITSVNSLSFISKQSLQGNVSGWPTTLYSMYEINGIDTYTSTPINLKEARIDFFGSLASSNVYYLHYSVAPNNNIDQYSVYDGSLYLIGRNFPLTARITPALGISSLATQTITISRPYTIAREVIAVGEINVTITNNTKPLDGASVTADNEQGGSVTSQSNSKGISLLTVPPGTYNVTVSKEGLTQVQGISVPSGVKATLDFAFTSNTPSDSLEYVLISFVIIGLIANVILWLRPKRLST